MIEILGVTLTYEALAFILVFIGDEIMPYLPIKSNGWLQLFHNSVKALKPVRKEDERIKAIVEELYGLRKDLEAGSRKAEKLLEKQSKDEIETTFSRGR